MNANNDKGATNVANDTPAALLPPIEHDEAYDRYYIPMPGGWEVQTKGKGSTFRIANSITGERFAIFEQPYLFEHLERMAREIHAASTATVASESRGSVPVVVRNGMLELRGALEVAPPRCATVSMYKTDARMLLDGLEAMLAAAPTPPAVASGEPPDWAIAQAFREAAKTARDVELPLVYSVKTEAAILARSAAAKG